MAYVLEEIAKTLKDARKRQGFSQRVLATKAAVPQSHISKIENAGVDLRLSSLIEIARALDLEVTLVPRKSVPAVKSIARSIQPEPISRSAEVNKEIKRLQESLRFALHEFPAVREIAQFQNKIRDLGRLPVPWIDSKALREFNKAVQSFESNAESLNRMRKSFENLERIRDNAIHSLPKVESVKPAYSLGEDDND